MYNFDFKRIIVYGIAENVYSIINIFFYYPGGGDGGETSE